MRGKASLISNGAGLKFDDHFPLTPALSLGERGKRSQRLDTGMRRMVQGFNERKNIHNRPIISERF